MKVTIHFIVFVSALIIIICTGEKASCQATVKAVETESAIDLSGEWQFRLDPDNIGETEQWVRKEFTDLLQLPGSVQEQGYGSDLSADLNFTAQSLVVDFWKHSPIFAPYREPGNLKLSWALTPEKHYVGSVFFKKQIIIPADWKGKALRLFLERPHWVTDLWVDGVHIGQENSLTVPHIFDIDNLSPGVHEITLRIDNRMHLPVGLNAQSLTDHTQTNWNGIIGRMELIPLPSVEISGIKIYPDIRSKQIRVEISLKDHGQEIKPNTLRIQASGKGENTHSVPARDYKLSKLKRDGIFEIVYSLGEEAVLWDEFNPNLYLLELSLLKANKLIDQALKTFGLREIGILGTQFKLNDENIFIRGSLENALYPETGYPPMDVESWREKIQMAKSYGLNHFRFHSWCPPDAAFIAADELGFYLQPEGPTWSTVEPGTPIAGYLFAEAEQIIDTYGNHPSFIMFACGNEIYGSNNGRSYFPDSILWYQLEPPTQVQESFGAAFLIPWANHFKEKAKGRQLICSSAGWPYIEENEYHIMHEPFRMRSIMDKIAPNTQMNYSNLVDSHNVPLISHETGQWCVYPYLQGSGKETDFLKEENLEIFRDFAEAGGVLKYSKQFHESSGEFQALLYKQEIEMMLRTPGAAGFQLLGLEDYPGHGFAPVGIVDAYGNEKSYISPDEFRQFCGPVIPLALMERRVWQNNEHFKAEIKIANYGGEDILNPVLTWEIADYEGKQRARGTIENKLIPNGGLVFLDSIQLDLDSFATPQKLQLTLGLSNSTVKNHWDFWVYPSDNALQDVKDILIFRQLDENMLKAIDSGKKILFIPEKNAVKAHNPGSFESIFWSTWSGTGTLGIHCEDSHPSLTEFPTENHTNWQWWELLRTSLPLDLTGIELQEDPVVQVIDNWIRARKLGILFEFSIGESNILVCAMDIENNLEERFVARQLRKSLIKYLDSKDFKPKSEITLEDLKSILGTNLKGIAAMGATVFTNQEFPPNLASNIADGDESSYWEAGIIPADYFELVVELPGYVKIDGLRLIPFGDGHDKPRISYDIFLSNDGTEWNNPVYEGFYPPRDEKEGIIRFSSTQNTRFIKIQFSDENGSIVPYISLAELELILNESVNQ